MADKNQDKNQSKNRAEQAEEHDESVLNPEIKNESDLSKKERRLIEKEKLKGMGPKKKLENKNSSVHDSGKFNGK